jgi:transcriptional/translational regulatory protein YebC/TACO1
LEYIPNTTIELDDDGLEKLSNFVELLEDDDDVNTVYTNAA